MFKKFFTSTLLMFVAIGGFFLSYNQNFHESSRSHYSLLGTYTYAVDCFTDECNAVVAAGNKKIQDSQNPEIKKMMDSLVAALNIVLVFLTILVSPAIMFASWLMTPDWTSGDLFNIRPIIHSLWITISNITYFIYAILLIFIALATIFNSDNYGYKAMLPKLALGIILVPLTWWIVQFVISASSYITASVMTIPAETMNAYNAKYSNGKPSFWNTPIIPSKITYTNDKSDISKWPCASDAGPGQPCVSPKDIMENAGGMYSPLLVYGYGIFSLHNSLDIKTTGDQIKNIVQLIHQGLIGALMFIVFGILVLALVFMLMVRAIKLWFYAIFSPLFTLQFVVGGEMFGENKDSFSIKEFLGLAFVPALVGLSLSFGLVIISALMSATGGDGKGNNTGDCTKAPCRIELMSNPKNYISSLQVKNDNGTTDTTNEIAFGGITYIYKGSVTAAEYTAGAQSVLSSAGGIFGTIIIDIIALVFIWVAFMAAKGVSKTVSAAITPFENMGKKIGELGMSLPKYTPIPGTGGLSMKSMERVPTSISDSISKNDSANFEKSSLGKMLHADLNIPPDQIKKVTDAIHTGKKEEFKEAWKNNQPFIDRQNSHNSGIVEEFIKKVKEDDSYLEHLGVDPIQRAKFNELKQKDLNSESTRKEILNLMRGTFGSGTNAGTVAGANASGYTMKESAIDKNHVIMNLGGNNINVGALKGKSAPEIAEVITKEIIAKITEFKEKPLDGDALKKLLDSEGLNGKEIADKVIKDLPPALHKKKDEKKPDPTKPS